MSLSDEIEENELAGEVERLERLLARKTALADTRKAELDRIRRSEEAQNVEIDALKKLLGVIEDVTEANPVIPKWVSPKKASKHHVGQPTLMLSDLHFDEVVDLDVMEGFNEYNREIATRRLTKVIDGTVDVAKNYISNIEYEGMILMLGGDILTGDIHEELANTNEGPVAASVVYWVGQLAAAIEHLADEFGQLFIPCVRGNHDRYGKKKQHKQQSQEAFTWIIYHWLQDHFATDDRITFAISPSSDYYFKVYNTRYLLTHGDQFRGGSGIAGIYCLGEDTKVLTQDLEWVKLSNLSVGDPIIGFDEDKPGKGQGREFKKATITSCDPVWLDSYVVRANGQDTLASENHLWLVRKRGRNVGWVATSDLQEGDEIMSVGETWEHDTSHDAGWLAGMYDGEGSLESNGRLCVSQNPGAVLDRMTGLLDQRGYEYATQPANQTGCLQVRSANGKSMVQTMQLVGSIRPTRMLDQSDKIWDGNSTKACISATVESVEYVGTQKLIAVGTSTKTLVANGMLSHNSPIMRGAAKKQQRNASLDRPFDHVIMGHFHQLIFGSEIVVNGSLKGYDEYAYDMNFAYEVPRQAFWITTPEHGITFPTAIYAEDHK